MRFDGLGGYLYTSAQVVMRSPNNNTRTCLGVTRHYFSFSIPNSAGLLGTRFYQQVLGAHTSIFTTTGTTLQLSRGGIGVIGK